MMTHEETSQALLALDAWLDSQAVSGTDKTIILMQWIAVEIVTIGNTTERFEEAIKLLSAMLESFARTAMTHAKELGVR